MRQGRLASAAASLTNRGLLRAVVAGFVLFLAYRFLAAVVATVLLLAVGLLLTVALSAPVEMLHRRKVPRPVSVLLIVVALLALAGLGGYVLFPTLAKETSLLASSLPDAVSQLVGRARELVRSLGVKIGGTDGVSARTLASVGRRVLGGALGLFSGLASFLTGLVVILFVPLYLAAIPGPVVGWVVRLSPPEKRCETRRILSEARDSVLSWLQGRLFSMVVVGVLSTIALHVIGIPGAIFLGLLSGLVSFVPVIGSVAGAAPPLLLAFAGDPTDALWVLLAYVLIQQVESNLLTPLVMQKTASVHPVVVIASVTVLSAAFGLLGALLAVPAAVVAGVLVEELYFKRLETKSTSIAP